MIIDLYHDTQKNNVSVDRVDFDSSFVEIIHYLKGLFIFRPRLKEHDDFKLRANHPIFNSSQWMDFN